MRKKIIALTLTICLSGAGGTAYANTSSTIKMQAQVQGEVVLETKEEVILKTQKSFAIDEKEMEKSAGVLPNSRLYNIDRSIEELEVSITESEEKLAVLKLLYADERAAEAAIMKNKGKDELANEAITEYMKTLVSASEHITNAIENENEAVQIIEILNESYKKNQAIFNVILDKSSTDIKKAIENILNEQDNAIAAVNDFYVAKEALLVAKSELEEAKAEQKAAEESITNETMLILTEKVKEAEALQDELEKLKIVAEKAKEEVNTLVEKAGKEIELSTEQDKEK